MTILLDRPATTQPARQFSRRNPAPPPEKTTRPFRELVDQLNQLNTAADVADLMRREGATGIRGKSDRCVIAEWLRTNFGDNPGLLCVASDAVVQIGYRRNQLNGATWSPPVIQFIRAFDRSAYPDLVRR